MPVDCSPINAVYIYYYKQHTQLGNNPTRNTVHVTFMYHAIIIDLHALHNMTYCHVNVHACFM